MDSNKEHRENNINMMHIPLVSSHLQTKSLRTESYVSNCSANKFISLDVG